MISDDGVSLSEMHSKRNLNLPMHSPGNPMEDADFSTEATFRAGQLVLQCRANNFTD